MTVWRLQSVTTTWCTMANAGFMGGPGCGCGQVATCNADKRSEAGIHQGLRIRFRENRSPPLWRNPVRPYSLVGSCRTEGRDRSAETGAEMYRRYRNLFNETSVPFVRAASAVRVVDSATNWTAGRFVCNSSVIWFEPVSRVFKSQQGEDKTHS